MSTSESKPTFEEVLAVYNSIHPSRRRWIRLRNQMRNDWKELFKALEQASGRTGAKVTLFDPEWHEVGTKGGVVKGAMNKKPAVAVVQEVVVEAPEIKKPSPAKKK